MSRPWLAACAAPFLVALLASGATRPAVDEATMNGTIESMIEKYGVRHEARIRRGVAQVAERFWLEDGDPAGFTRFCLDSFLIDDEALERTFLRLESVMEQVDGHLHEVRRELTRPLDLDTGEVFRADRLLGDLDLAAHVGEDLYSTKVAFFLLLNFPVHTLAERLERSPEWSREDWARSRMMDRFALRIPATVAQGITAAFTRADQYIAAYNIRLDRLVPTDGGRPFPEGLRLITHWGLRDEIKSQYAAPDGLARQRLILRLMDRIVRQEIPAEVIDNGELLWSPEDLRVWRRGGNGSAAGDPITAVREPDTRYARLLDVFHAVRAADAYAPTAPTFIERRFERDREIPEKQVEDLLVAVLASDELRELAARIRERLGRPLEAFDIWYDGFKARGDYSRDELDRRVRERYPDLDAFQADLPRILRTLGFDQARADWLAERIVVDPARGAGHAMGAVRREDRAHLRTRFGPDGMDYKGFNIAVHELGHNVEQVFSLNAIDHWWLSGVPNNAFTEALAFVFQNRDLELLGLEPPGAKRPLEALDTLWSTAEIGGVALVDMGVWRYLYRHPQATPAELREATLTIARSVWNRHFSRLFGVRDQEILAIYSHMIVYGLYLPDYPLGHLIAFQVSREMERGSFGESFERIARQGRLTPDAWMRGAVGSSLSAEALLTAARQALEREAQQPRTRPEP